MREHTKLGIYVGAAIVTAFIIISFISLEAIMYPNVESALNIVFENQTLRDGIDAKTASGIIEGANAAYRQSISNLYGVLSGIFAAWVAVIITFYFTDKSSANQLKALQIITKEQTEALKSVVGGEDVKSKLEKLIVKDYMDSLTSDQKCYDDDVFREKGGDWGPKFKTDKFEFVFYVEKGTDKLKGIITKSDLADWVDPDKTKPIDQRQEIKIDHASVQEIISKIETENDYREKTVTLKDDLYNAYMKCIMPPIYDRIAVIDDYTKGILQGMITLEEIGSLLR